jgi:LysM repeat protein
MSSEYIVKSGDTLSQIARSHRVSVDDLVNWNGIANPSLIHPGQVLRVSSPNRGDVDTFFSELWIRVTDATGAPIPALKTTIVGGTREYEHVTDQQGLIPPVRALTPAEKIQVFVEKIDGGKRKVAELKPPAGVHQATISSPKLKSTIRLRVHEGGADHQEKAPVHLPPAAVQHNRDSAGNPVVNVSVECPNKDNLRLGPNSKFRDAILMASKRSGFKPQAVASIVNIEAAKLRIAVEREIKIKGKIKKKVVHISTGEWDPNSAAGSSSARGLTQFLSGTWIGEALRSGTFVNEKALAKGWVANDKHGRCQVAEGHKDDLLDFRTDADAAINAAVDYGLRNFQALAANGYDFSKLNDGERAKLLYLRHHLGGGDANRFLAGTIVADDTYTPPDAHGHQRLIARGAKALLIAQVGEAAAAKRADECGGNYVQAHRLWLTNLIDTGVNFKNFACDPSKLDDVRSLTALVTIVGGKNPAF